MYELCVCVNIQIDTHTKISMHQYLLTTYIYRPHPKDGEGNVSSLCVSSYLGGGVPTFQGGGYLPFRVGVPTFPGLDRVGTPHLGR